ncbi:glycosyltransferase family 4 protein [Shewanella baltica]|uniref:glycosyltransferase family 4 protein n=1 Tax=Shewanella baltica TaxID=62322 RepID=UPI000DFCCBE4|nr:glycosyltransferase family 4 protein [Shewanella baltica]SUI48729.1 putative glycosyl transferase [Shewanella baltica]
MRILFISQLFDPEYSIKGLELMKHWVNQGHEVEVLTTFPNYPTGRVFDGYSVKFKSTELSGGVKITRLWSHISHSKSKLSRATSYLSFTFMALFAALLGKKADLVYTYHPQSTTGLIGIAMRVIRGTPYITDVQDLWPDALIATGMNKKSFIVKLIGKWCDVIYRSASQVIVLSQGYKAALIDRGVRPDKVTVVYNWCPEEKLIDKVLVQQCQINHLTTKPAHILYAGNMGAAQSLKTLIDAVSTFNRDDVQLTLIGGGVEKHDLQKYILELNIANVDIKDYVPPNKIFAVLSEADVLVVHLRDAPLFKITIPSKTQSSLAMGKPILMAVGGETNALLESANAGVTAEPGDVNSIILAIKKLLLKREQWGDMGNNARDFYLKNMSMSINYAKLDSVLNMAVEKK